MARGILGRWFSDPGSSSRKDRRSCEYEAYLPDALTGRSIKLDAEVATDIAEAETDIVRLNAETISLVNTEALARLLLRAESVASSRIEGLSIGARRLLRMEAAQHSGDVFHHVTAIDILANISAMNDSVLEVQKGQTITIGLLKKFHQRLLKDSHMADHAGHFRTTQNWIGGSHHNPCSADFIPPPPEHVEELMKDLCSFCNSDDLPIVAQAAMAHAQFETIHPFVDGNGRTGRALIHMIMRRRGLAEQVLVPVSLILAASSKDYVQGLSATRYRGPASSRQAHEGLNLWIGRFAVACRRAVEDVNAFEKRAQRIDIKWRQKLGRVRANSATDLLIRALLGAPVITVKSAAALIQRSFPQVNDAIQRLEQAGILHQISVGKRNRAFEAPDIIDAFTTLERRLADASN